MTAKPPPVGKGVYARAQSADWLSRFDFVCINATRNDAEAVATALIAMGVEVWFYRGPDAFLPSKDEVDTVAKLEALILRTGAAGAIADPETGWNESPTSRAVRFASAIRASVARGFRWGLTSFPTMRHVETMASSGAWGSPQIYAPDDARLIPRWASAFGADNVCLSVALWGGHFYVFTDVRAYAQYLAALPSTRGSIGWTTDQSTDSWVNAYLTWQQVKAGFTLGPGASTGIGWAVSSVLAGAVAVWWAWRQRRR